MTRARSSSVLMVLGGICPLVAIVEAKPFFIGGVAALSSVTAGAPSGVIGYCGDRHSISGTNNEAVRSLILRRSPTVLAGLAFSRSTPEVAHIAVLAVDTLAAEGARITPVLMRPFIIRAQRSVREVQRAISASVRAPCITMRHSRSSIDWVVRCVPLEPSDGSISEHVPVFTFARASIAWMRWRRVIKTAVRSIHTRPRCTRKWQRRQGKEALLTPLSGASAGGDLVVVASENIPKVDRANFA